VLEEGPTIFGDKWGTKEVDLFFIGKKAADLFSKRGFSVHSLETHIIDKPNFTESSKFADILMGYFMGRIYNRIYVAFNEFRNPAVQIPVIEQFLPIVFPKSIRLGNKVNADVIFESSRTEIVKSIIPKAMKIKFHGYILEVSAGEHGARMTAMHQATDNATELIRDLTLQYNKARQAAITKEILEIVSGAEALKG
jgi:F-type H+-transporting ATPase subunit gamma